MDATKFKYRFDSSRGILFKDYYGSITLDDIRSSWEYAIENNLIPKETKGFILDYRNATFDLKIDEYSGISNFYKEHIEIFGNHKIAIITEHPKDVVIPVMVKTMDDGYFSEPFCTLEAAIRWVLSEIF